jgi:hypothetical protein
MVCVVGIEPTTPTVSRWCSPTELHAHAFRTRPNIAEALGGVKRLFSGLERTCGGRLPSVEAALMEKVAAIEEVLRIPSPAPRPQALACLGEHLWMGSWETGRIYGIDRAHFTVFEERPAPGKPVSLCPVGSELRGVMSEGGEEDHRFIRRYIPGHGFTERDKIPCPDDTGSFLAYDGTSLWLSQRYNMRVLLLGPNAEVEREISSDGQILGLCYADGSLYTSLWFGKDGGGKIGRVSGDRVEVVASLPYGAISLAYDGNRFWCNEPKSTSIIAFTF